MGLVPSHVVMELIVNIQWLDWRTTLILTRLAQKWVENGSSQDIGLKVVLQNTWVRFVFQLDQRKALHVWYYCQELETPLKTNDELSKGSHRYLITENQVRMWNITQHHRGLDLLGRAPF